MEQVSVSTSQCDAAPYGSKNPFFQQLTELPFPPPAEFGTLFDGYKVPCEIQAGKRVRVYLSLDTEANSRVMLT